MRVPYGTEWDPSQNGLTPQFQQGWDEAPVLKE